MRLQHVGITVPADAIPDARAFYGGPLDLPREWFFVRDPFGNLIELVTPRA